MSNLPEIIDLFTKLAINLENPISNFRNEDQQPIDSLVSNLNQSLNLNDNSRVRVLDTVLSLMGFTAPQVFNSVIECSVKTIVSVLRSSINCKVLRIDQEDILQVGGSISLSDYKEVIEDCVNILEKLRQYGIVNSDGTLSCLLLHAVIRAITSATRFRNFLRLAPNLEVKTTDSCSHIFSKLFCHVQKISSVKSEEIPLRLLCWYLDPHTLKHDVSQILHEAIKRPFLCLSVEVYERMEWRSIIIYLVLSPAMFVETISVLHNWFLMTGLASVLEFQIELASLVLDVLSRPMWWGLSAEMGSNLPYSHAYFPYNHHLFSSFAGPLSCEKFLQLFQSINKAVPPARGFMVDHKSVWAMAMNFPDWFYLASMLFFGESYQDGSTSETAMNKESHKNSPSYSAAASRYIAWILDPINQLNRDSLTECLNNLSASLNVKQSSSSDKHEKKANAYKKKLKKPKLLSKGDEISLKANEGEEIRRWLMEFQKKITSRELKPSQEGIGLQQNLLYRRVSLGFLIGCPNALTDEACEYILHYAATGTIFPSTVNRRSNFEKFSRKEAIAGACLVFYLTDIVESISGSLFETEESGLDFICRVKLRVGKYLLDCVQRIVRHEIDENVLLMLKDLYNRLLRWKYQGRDVFQGSKDLDDVIFTLSSKLSLSYKDS